MKSDISGLPVKVGSRKYRYFGKVLGWLPLRWRVSLTFFLKHGRVLRLKNPASFNEKVQWRKVYDSNPLLAVAADKIASKKFVRERCDEVNIPRVLWEGTSADSINFLGLPPSYVIKANHGSRMNIFVHNGKHPDVKELRKVFKAWEKHDQGSVLGEVAYNGFKKRFFIEEFLAFSGDYVPVDYKFFVFDGQVKFVQVDSGRFVSHKRNIMNREWVDTGIKYTYSRQEPSPKMPANYRKMVQIAEVIGRGLDFIRVDLYTDEKSVYFGELTVYPGAGYERFEDSEDDMLLGKYWRLPEVQRT